MVARSNALFVLAPTSMKTVAIVGALTAIFAASIGLVQNDIKRVLAYSTVSQLGYMFLALGVGAFAAGVFHVFTHAFFKALLFLGAGSVIHAMSGEQDMRNMGDLKHRIPVTYWTMFIATLAIAGIPPFAGFFSKDEILWQTWTSEGGAYRILWGIGYLTALMTAFYMFRLISMTFLGAYRGPAWDHGHAAAAAPRADRAKAATVAATHGAPHPADPHAHGQAHKDDHEVAHGPAEPHPTDDSHAAHGHGPWHGPHESPTAMTFPLMVLAIGAIVAGFVGIPAALFGSGSSIEKFLEPSFTATHVEARAPEPGAAPAEPASAAHTAEAEHEESHVSRGAELGLMAFSVLLALVGLFTAYRFYVVSPEISERLAHNWSGAHRVLSNKYYVDELYEATVINGTFAGGRGLWTFDRNVVDGVVNGSGWLTIISAWFSGLTDRTVVDGIVNLVGRICEEGSFWFRKLQTGLVQNYAMWMLVGIFAFVSIYLFIR
jgi:NADH-quinone oxidoreductase subunit L